MSKKQSIVIVVGETASGKSALAMQLAKKFEGEIICADSRTVYVGMDIGTAKPSLRDREEVTHYLLDVVNPNQRFTVHDFKSQAERLITEISDRGKLPIVVGGTGLYIDALIFDYSFGSMAENKKRDHLNGLELFEIQKVASSLGISPNKVNFYNKRYLIRAIELGGVTNQVKLLRDNTLLIGLSLEREVLRQRVHDRIESMVDSGFVDEVRTLTDKYGWDCEAMTGIGYRAFRDYLGGKVSLDTAKEIFENGDMKLAKKQRTWFKRNKYIQWVNDPSQAVALTTTFLNT